MKEVVVAENGPVHISKSSVFSRKAGIGYHGIG